MRHVVVEEGLSKEGVDGRSEWIAAYRPLVIEQYTDHPMSRCGQKDGRWAEQEFAGPENRIVGGRNGEDWANAPDEFARVRWRKNND